MKAASLSLVSMLLSLPAMSVLGQEKPAQPNVPTMSGALVMETILGLALVVILIFALGWAMKRFGRLPTGGNSLITVLGGVSLGPRERVVLLEVDGVKLLLGVAPGRVSKIHTLGVDDLREHADAPAFDKTLETALKGKSS